MSAKIIEDSISPDGIRLATMQLKYWLPIHAEFLTHRVFSRNAASNRAIPVAKVIDQVRNDPAGPIHWGKNQPGMQAREELTGDDLIGAKAMWANAAKIAATNAEAMATLAVHKQVANRLLMPYQWMHVIVSATEWDNFFELRDHPDAQPEIRALAQEMKAAMDASTPKLLQPGEWHLPYVSEQERQEHDVDTLKKISTARCARVSYLTHSGENPVVEKDIELYERLVGATPLHASPCEHQATPDTLLSAFQKQWGHPAMHGNFTGWIQFRKQIERTLWSK